MAKSAALTKRVNKVLTDTVPMTVAERRELEQRPIGSGFRVLTDSEFTLRLSIAQKQQTKELGYEQVPAWAKEILMEHPKLGFYRYTDSQGNKRCHRIYGVYAGPATTESNEHAKGVCGLMVMDGGFQVVLISTSDKGIERVNHWSSDDLTAIQHLNDVDYSLFIDPLGHFYISLLKDCIGPDKKTNKK